MSYEKKIIFAEKAGCPKSCLPFQPTPILPKKPFAKNAVCPYSLPPFFAIFSGCHFSPLPLTQFALSAYPHFAIFSGCQ